MIELTASNNSKLFLDGSKVVRIRKALSSMGELGVATHIDWVEVMLVKEEIDIVATKVTSELNSLVQLSTLTSPIWFDAKQATGPVALLSTDKGNGARSALILLGKRQQVTNTPEEVAAAIKQGHGNPLPIPQETLMALPGRLFNSFRNWLAPIPEWDGPSPQ